MQRGVQNFSPVKRVLTKFWELSKAYVIAVGATTFLCLILTLMLNWI